MVGAGCLPLTVPSGGHRLGSLRGAALGLHRTLLVKQVRQRRRFDPDIGVAADTFGREGEDIAVKVAHEGTGSV